MDKGGHGGNSCGLLPTTRGCSADEHPEVFPVESTRLPELAESIDEGLPLCRKVAVTGGNAKEEGVILGQDFGGGERDVLFLTRSVHLREDFLWEGLFDPGSKQ